MLDISFFNCFSRDYVSIFLFWIDEIIYLLFYVKNKDFLKVKLTLIDFSVKLTDKLVNWAN